MERPTNAPASIPRSELGTSDYGSSAVIRRPLAVLLWSGIALLVLGCSDRLMEPSSRRPDDVKPSLGLTLVSYFPPSEANGGWRQTTRANKSRSLGMEPTGLAALGSYAMSLPYERYSTGVSGYALQNKAVLVIKNGWIVGEYYNGTSARTAVYYLASNGKTFAMMLF